ncbi:MAG: Clp protease N-terminal domain-containing protein [Candidatus Dormibacteria bacterium]
MSTESAAEAYHPWSAFLNACDEARRRGDRRVGTEHLLLGLLHEEGMARALGVDLAAARAALDGVDREALTAIGVGAYPEPAATPGTRPRRPGLRAVLRDRMPITATAKRVLQDTRPGMRPGHPIPVERLLLLALCELEPPDAAATLLGHLGVDRTQVRSTAAA